MLDANLEGDARLIVRLFQQLGQSGDRLEDVLLQNGFLPANQSRITHHYKHLGGLEAGISQRYPKNQLTFGLVFEEFEEGVSRLDLEEIYHTYLPKYIEIRGVFASLLGKFSEMPLTDEDLDGSRYKSVCARWKSPSALMELNGGFGGPEDGFSVGVSVQKQ